MTPGRELDALVAERVMGWRWLPVRFVWDDEPLVYLLPPGGITEDVNSTTSGAWDENRVWHSMPCYSTDIAAAWEVVEKMQAAGWGWCLEQHENADVPTAWFLRASEIGRNARFSSPEQMEEKRSASGAMPHAICIAALKAVGHEVPS
jgi:hypothetical protein